MSASPTTTFSTAHGSALDSYSGIYHGLHEHCCVTHDGRFTNLSLAELASTAPPRFQLAPAVTSEVIGHCRIEQGNAIGEIVPNRFHDADYTACLRNSTDKQITQLWAAIVTTSRSGTVLGFMTALETFITSGTATPSTWARPTGTTYDAGVVDFYSGIHLDRMAAGCERVKGVGFEMSLESFNATAPNGFYLRSNISSERVGSCRVGMNEAQLLAQYLSSPSGTEHTYWDPDRWFIVTNTDDDGIIRGFTENGPNPWRTFGTVPGGASPTGATLSASSSGTSSPTSPAPSSATSRLGRVRLGLVSLVAMAASAVVTL